MQGYSYVVLDSLLFADSSSVYPRDKIGGITAN